MELGTELSEAIEAAREAGRFLREPEGIAKARSAISRHLEASGHPMIANHDEPERWGEDALVWYVNAPGGLENFRRGLPIYCVSISLWKGCVPQLAVVLDVDADELYVGTSELGVRCNENRIKVEDESDVSRAILCTHNSDTHRSDQRMSHSAYENASRFRKVRELGCADLAMSYLARGRVHAFQAMQTPLSEVAAGIALVQFAGGDCDFDHFKESKWIGDLRCACTREFWSQSA